MQRGLPAWAKPAIAAGVLAIIGAVGGPYAYIHFISPKAAAPLSLGTTTSSSPAAGSEASPGTPTTATASSTPLDGTWSVASGSTAGYRVQETLLGQSETATGRTSTIAGSLTVSGGTLTAGSFSVDLTTVASDKAMRDSHFQRNIMDTATYPTARFEVTQPVALGPEPADGVTVTRQVTGNLTLHGVTRSVTFSVSVKKTGSTVAALGSIPVTFSDYGIPNPSIGGFVTTADNGTLEFLLNFTRSSSPGRLP